MRPVDRLPAPEAWSQTRVAELTRPGQPIGKMRGVQGPDQGYALSLAHRFESQLNLKAGEHAEDAIAACVGVAMTRASHFGRAPVSKDLEVAFSIWGFIGSCPDGLADERTCISGASHNYWVQLDATNRVPEIVAAMSLEQVESAKSENWKSLFEPS